MAENYEQAQMQSDYSDEESRGSGGLMSIAARSAGDYLFGGDIMDMLPEISRAFDEGAALESAVRRGPSEQGDALTMRIEEIRAQPLDEGMAYDISQAQGLESLLSPELAMVLGATGPGKKGEGIKSFIELMKSFNIKPDQSILDEAKKIKDLSDDFLKNQGKRNTEKDIEQTRYQQGTVPDDTNYPEGHPFRDWDKSKTQIDRERKDSEDSELDWKTPFDKLTLRPEGSKPFGKGTSIEFAKLSNEGKQEMQRLLRRRNKLRGELMEDPMMSSQKQITMQWEIERLEEKLRPYFPIDRMASGGRPKPSAGGMSYKKGYYGKSYK
tara:strand:- start:371 stop:1345 length:975 start_codon:yes stop_codon:yes gene_type:complete